MEETSWNDGDPGPNYRVLMKQNWAKHFQNWLLEGAIDYHKLSILFLKNRS
jgi:hypothetical protein